MDDWIKTRHHLDSDGSMTVQRTQDVEPILDRNKAFQNTPQKKSELMGHHIGSIPLIIVEKWANEEGFNILDTGKHGKAAVTKFMKRKLADPDWQYLKTR